MTFMWEISVLLAVSVFLVTLFKFLNLGSVLGYLVAGLLVGPWGFRLIADLENISHVSELGIILMLFIIGLELQPSRLWILRKPVFVFGGCQFFFTALGLFAIFSYFQFSFYESIIASCGLALSSSAFVLQILGERQELKHAYGRSAFSVLLFQDLVAIPFLAMIPFLGAGRSFQMDNHSWMAFIKVFGAFMLLAFVGVYVIKPFFRILIRSRNYEIFTATALLTVLSSAQLMHSVGLSMSLGAFLAGVMLANSEHRHELQATIDPFKSLLLGLFFMSVGMSANLGLLSEMPAIIFLCVFTLIFVKFAVIFILTKLWKHPLEFSIRTGLALAQGGEFAFVIFTLALQEELMAQKTADLLLLVVTGSMALTPFMFKLADFIVSKAATKPEERPFDKMDGSMSPTVIIAGFGRVGQIVGRILLARKIKFTALDVNQEQIDFVRKFGNKVFYGDPSRLELLRAASIDKAKILVIAVDSIEASVQTVKIVKKHYPDIKIFARARNRNHSHLLYDAGVDYSIRETFASSLELSEEILIALGASREEAKDNIARFRAHDESALEAGRLISNDEDKLIDAARKYTKDLESLFDL